MTHCLLVFQSYEETSNVSATHESALQRQRKGKKGLKFSDGQVTDGTETIMTISLKHKINISLSCEKHVFC